MGELRNVQRLEGVHPDLVRVIKRAAAAAPFNVSVIEGLRSIATQRRYVASGASKTMNSRHLDGHAVDLAPMDGDAVSWAWPLYFKLAPVVKQAAKDEGVPIEWGGDWRSFKDGPHWQLPFAQYPKGGNKAPAGNATHLLRQGSTGDEVKRLQTLLGITADGSFGPATRAAVIAFQKAQGISPDGVVGNATWAKLDA